MKSNAALRNKVADLESVGIDEEMLKSCQKPELEEALIAALEYTPLISKMVANALFSIL